MNKPASPLPVILEHSPVRVAFGDGALDRLGDIASGLGASHVLLVTDPAIRGAGHADRAVERLRERSIRVSIFDGAETNPTDRCIERGCEAARSSAIGAAPIDLVVGLGGGSAMDCAKGINLVLSAGGRAADYRGDPPLDALARRQPLLPMILVPTTAGTGSEAQSFALISDHQTRAKMACGDRRPPPGGLRPCWAILDPRLARTMPPSVAAATAIDALTHAVETAGCRVRTDVSRAFSRAAWERLTRSGARAMRDPADGAALADMLLGAHLAGAAIEYSMLGAAHACANPLTARFDVVHGFAVGLMLPHVVRFNCERGENPYADLDPAPEALTATIGGLLAAAGAPRTLREVGVAADTLPELARLAAEQWTAGFNPRPVTTDDLLWLYRQAYDSPA